MSMPFLLNNDYVFPGGLQYLILTWGMNHLGNAFCQAQDYLSDQPYHDLAHGLWPSWDM